MPRRETRHDIERALSEQRRKRALIREEIVLQGAALARRLAKLRDVLDPASFARVQSQLLRGSHRFRVEVRHRRRRPEDGGMPAPVEPPRGPAPLAGGAAAPLEFD